MKIAIATRDYATVATHAGRARHWLVYDCLPDAGRPAPERIELAEADVFHHAREDAPHPLDGIELVIAGSAGEGFLRHLARRGAEVVLTGETDPPRALDLLLAGEGLPEQRPDLTRVLCRLRDLFARY